MDKNKIDRFINKYLLAGKVNAVKWKADDNKLTATFVREDKALLGQVSADKFEFEDLDTSPASIVNPFLSICAKFAWL